MRPTIALLVWLGVFGVACSARENARYRYACVNKTCTRLLDTDTTVTNPLSLMHCQMTCNERGIFWPVINGQQRLGQAIAQIDVNSIRVIAKFPDGSATRDYLYKAIDRLRQQIRSLIAKRAPLKPGGAAVEISVYLNDPGVLSLSLTTKEGYELTVTEGAAKTINVTINADNFFGARHGLETLSQMFIYDQLTNEVQMFTDASISDSPKFAYRGLLLDTARNFMSVKALKRTLDAMGMAKLNQFHWHITDSHSFPFVAPSHPELAQVGAYSPAQTYAPDEIKELVDYAKVRGVQIIPEFDAPSHVGEGWQGTGLVECFNIEPWSKYCVEPPCGVFNPTKDRLYDVLEHLYKDYVDLFKPEIFHMGGDEVDTTCWRSTANINEWMRAQGWNHTESDYMNLWYHFQTNAFDRLQKVKSGLPVVLWTSKLTTSEHIDFLPNDKYIIQIWTQKNDPAVKFILEKGYKVILSTYDSLYLDCGFGSWVANGTYWCSPFNEWQKIYDYYLKDINTEHPNQVLGAEAALWTEVIDESTLDSTLWPRASALGERLWSDPNETYRFAEERMLIHRERLVQRGISAQALKPQWCRHNQGKCVA